MTPIPAPNAPTSGFGVFPVTHGPGIGLGQGVANTVTPVSTSHTATASSAHDMLKAVMLELGFVVVATMLAGISDSWGSSMLALMLVLLVLRGLFEVDIFAAFAQGTTLHPT